MKSFIGAVLFICVAFSANAQLLWKVSGNGLNQPSYIIGTHHLAPFSIMDSIAGLQKAMKETQQVYGELKMSEMQSPVTMQKMQQAMMIANDSTLSTLLSPEDFATANKFCKENLMLDLSAAPKLKPAFLLNNVVVQNGGRVGDGVLLNPGVEVHHDSFVDDCSLIYTNSVVRTLAHVGKRVRIGSNVSISNNVNIADDSDIPNGTTL